MTPRAHADFAELAVGYALHALEPADEVRFAAHLPGCAACQRAVADHVDTLALLAATAPDAEPPPSLLEGIRAAVAADGGERATAPAPARASAPGADVTPAPVVDLAARRAAVVRVKRSWLLSAAAAVTALVLGLGGWAAVLHGDRGRESDRGDRLAQAVAAMERTDTRTVRLADFDGEVEAVVVAGRDGTSLVVDGLPRNGDDSIYVLWGQHRSGEVTAVSTFDVSRDGLDVVKGLQLAAPVDDLSALMVTREKGRTAPPQAESKVLVAGQV